MKVRSTTLITVIVALLLAAGVAVSQTVRKAAQHDGFGGGFGPEHHMMRMMADYLDLTDAQQAQVKQIFAAEKPAMQPLMQQVRQTELQLRQLETSGNFDEAKARELASQEAQARTELTVERAKIHAQIFNLLTPEQKTKAIDMLKRHEQKMQNHMQQNQAPAQQQ
jgi:Spy/CpxP family protein refolding chaperone